MRFLVVVTFDEPTVSVWSGVFPQRSSGELQADDCGPFASGAAARQALRRVRRCGAVQRVIENFFFFILMYWQ
jgi:hypothetical protein